VISIVAVGVDDVLAPAACWPRFEAGLLDLAGKAGAEIGFVRFVLGETLGGAGAGRPVPHPPNMFGGGADPQEYRTVLVSSCVADPCRRGCGDARLLD